MKSRLPTPTWGAARPTPLAASLVSNMSAIRVRSSSSKTSTSAARRCSTGSPQIVIGKTVMSVKFLGCCRRLVVWRSAGDAAADDVAHDFVGAAEDGEQPGGEVGLGDRVFHDVTVAAVQLEAAVRDRFGPL